MVEGRGGDNGGGEGGEGRSDDDGGGEGGEGRGGDNGGGDEEWEACKSAANKQRVAS